MSVEVKLPTSGEGKSQMTLTVWHKLPGQKVTRGEPLFDLQVGNSSELISIYAPSSGVLDMILLKKDQQGLPGQPAAIIKTAPTFLAEDTDVRLNQQRLLEQDGLRKLTGKRVIARERELTDKPKADFGLEANYGSALQDHPLLDTQQYDGIDPSVNPAPALSDPEARREYDNARNEQQLQNQLRLGMQPGKDTAPKPQGP